MSVEKIKSPLPYPLHYLQSVSLSRLLLAQREQPAQLNTLSLRDWTEHDDPIPDKLM